MKRTSVIAIVLLLAAASGFAEPAPAGDAGKALSVRSFQFKYKDADKAAAMIKALVSPDGSISIQPSTNSLVVTDRAENLKNIAVALTKFDAPARALKLSVRLVGAARVEPQKATPVSDDLKDVALKLSMLRFNAFEDLGSSAVDGKEGDPGIVELASGYRADFRFGEYDPASDSIKINDFKLARLQGPKKDQLTPLLKTSLNLKVGQTVILGASKVPQSERALMIVVVARR
ncbi:MAG TPA: secretin N-terminal domain-containing protein [Thermoanaerobaculia bacterium]|nr:secretin N-terminal domain-containing protein [Thermoanaerobaculia bacterium]